MTTATAALPVRDHTYYPDSDGQPVGETPRHVKNFAVALGIIERFFAGDPNVYVGGNMFVYYVMGDRDRSVCPDLFVVKGVPKVTEPERRSYRTWEENGKGPDVVIEFTSRKTRRQDTKTKPALYRDVLKVKEYFLFDPYAQYLRPPLQGYRLTRGDYVPVKPVGGRLASRVLGLHLEAQDDLLRFWDPAAHQYLLTPDEEATARRRAEATAEREARARRRADAEVERLRREIEELRRRSS